MQRYWKWILLLLVPALLGSSAWLPHRRKAFRSADSFSPSDISGLLFWYSADEAELGTPIEGDRIGIWYDRSGNGRNATNSTGVDVSKPFFTNSVINGKPALAFTGNSTTVTNWLWLDAGSSSATNYSLFIVARHRTASGQNLILHDWSGNLVFAADGGGGSGVAYNDGVGWRDLGVDRVADVWKLFSYTLGSDWGQLWTNGVAANTNGYTQRAFTAVGLGAERNNSLQNSLSGDIAEIFMYSQKVSTNDRVRVESYLYDKYFPGGYP